MKRQIIIVGGGVAGLSAAWCLAKQGSVGVTLLEKERLLCSHASGQNAAIFRPLEEDVVLASLAQRSARLFEQLSPDAPLLETNGLVLLHDTDEFLLPIQDSARRAGFRSEVLGPLQLTDVLKGLTLQGSLHGLYSPAGGVIDIHAVSAALSRRCRALGVQIIPSAGVARLVTSGQRVAGVEVFGGEQLGADEVVLAAGAWSAQLAASVECWLPLSPVRRHLALLQPVHRIGGKLPAVWKLNDEVYFRCEGDRLLASPCDETICEPGSPPSDLEELAPLARKLSKIDRRLGEASVARYWACLRTFAPDRRPVVGTDSRVAGLHWLAALGGFGMTTGLGAGECLARALLDGQQVPQFSPDRFDKS